jgi:hypothetical protein
VIGVGFAAAFRAERAVEERLPTADLEADDLVNAFARTAGAIVTAMLVVVAGDSAALVIAGVVAALAGIVALSLPVRAPELTPERAGG